MITGPQAAQVNFSPGGSRSGYFQLSSLPWSEWDSVSQRSLSMENQKRVRAVENSIWGEGFGA